MKKFKLIGFIIMALCLASLLMACNINTCNCNGECEHKYDNDCDKICNKCFEEREVEGHELVTPDVEGCQVPSYCTICDYQTCEEKLLHNYVDEYGKEAKFCIVCGKPNESFDEPIETISKGEAIIIAQNHFHATHNIELSDGFTYVPKYYDEDNENWYILLFIQYVKNDPEYDYAVHGGGFTYTINKLTGEIVYIEAGE